MIAIIVGNESWRGGAVPLALAYAGFEPCETADPDDAARRIDESGPQGCLLVLEAGTLSSEGSEAGGWERLLDGNEAVPAVLVVCGGLAPQARALLQAPHRVVLEDPFDAAAVVAAAIRASAMAARRVQRPSNRESPASKYAS